MNLNYLLGMFDAVMFIVSVAIIGMSVHLWLMT